MFTFRLVKAAVNVFKKDSRGSIAIISAIFGMVVCAAAGCAIDYGRQYNLKLAAQDDLDAAVLAAVQSKGSVEKSLASWLKQAGNGAYKIEALKSSASSTSVALNAEISAEIPASFMGMFGVKTLGVHVASAVSAPRAVTEMEVKIDEAYGYSNKAVKAKVERPDGTVETLVTVNYTFTDPKGAGGRGTGTTAVSPAGKISTGEFKRLWFEMIVTEHDTKQNVTYSTEDPKTSNHLYVDGKMLPLGATVGFNELIPCGSKPLVHQWEDSWNPDEWGIQDITLTVKGKCDDVKKDLVRLLN